MYTQGDPFNYFFFGCVSVSNYKTLSPQIYRSNNPVMIISFLKIIVSTLLLLRIMNYVLFILMSILFR